MTKPRILITGAGGFVGSQILASFDARYDLHVVMRVKSAAGGATWHDADLLDPTASHALIRDIRPSHLIHSAWETTHGVFWESDSNRAWLDAGKALFSAFCAQGGQRIIGCGSCAEYAGSPDPIAERDDQVAPSSLYGRSKRDLLQSLARLPVSYAWARIFYPYGIGEGAARFVPSICQSLLRGREAKCSSGTQLRNFLDVRDLGSAIAKLTVHGLEGAINLGYPVSYRLGQVARTLGDIANHPELISLGALPDRDEDPAVLIPDLQRQTNELKFNPKIKLRDGLRDAYDWWNDKAVKTNRLNQHVVQNP